MLLYSASVLLLAQLLLVADYVPASVGADPLGQTIVDWADWTPAEEDLTAPEAAVTMGALGPDGDQLQGKRARNSRLARLLGPDKTHDGRKRSRSRGGARYRPLSALLRPDITYDGRRKRFPKIHRKSLQSSLNRPGGAYDPYLIALLRPDIIHDGKRSAEEATLFKRSEDKKKRFLDSLAMARPIYSGKRFIETLASARPVHQGRRKRLLDSLVRARPIYDGKR